MLNLRVKRLMISKGIANPHSFLVKNGINHTTATKILSSRCKNLKVEYIELLCWHISCTPNELFEWEPDSKYVDHPGHPLQAVRLPKIETNLPKLLKKLSKNQIMELSTLAVDMLIENEGGKKREEKA